MPSLPPRVAVRHDEIHVTCVRLDDAIEDAWGVLDDEERARAGRFLRDRDRRRFIVSHAATRLVLGACLGQPPASFAFVRGAHGKPHLAAPHGDVAISLSHAGERALVAVTIGRAVGVDVEQERMVDELRLARRFFSPGEAASLAAVPAGDRNAAFFRCWTRKEAFVKALGDGLSFPLQGFEVEISGGAHDQALRASRRPAMVDRWRIAPLEVEPGYAAAVAAEAGPWRIVRWDGIDDPRVRATAEPRAGMSGRAADQS